MLNDEDWDFCEPIWLKLDISRLVTRATAMQETSKSMKYFDELFLSFYNSNGSSLLSSLQPILVPPINF